MRQSWITLVITLPLLVACGAAPAGAPAAPTTLLPSRPAELPIDSLDPCTVFSEGQQETLNLGNETFTPGNATRGPTCQWSTFPDQPRHSYLVGIVLGTDAEQFTDLPPPAQVTATDVNGYPAVETDAVGMGLPTPEHCSLFVGVANGQTLQVGYGYSGGPPVTLEQSCAKARTAAEMAVETLISQNGAR